MVDQVDQADLVGWLARIRCVLRRPAPWSTPGTQQRVSTPAGCHAHTGISAAQIPLAGCHAPHRNLSSGFRHHHDVAHAGSSPARIPVAQRHGPHGEGVSEDPRERTPSGHREPQQRGFPHGYGVEHPGNAGAENPTRPWRGAYRGFGRAASHATTPSCTRGTEQRRSAWPHAMLHASGPAAENHANPRRATHRNPGCGDSDISTAWLMPAEAITTVALVSFMDVVCAAGQFIARASSTALASAASGRRLSLVVRRRHPGQGDPDRPPHRRRQGQRQAACKVTELTGCASQTDRRHQSHRRNARTARRRSPGPMAPHPTAVQPALVAHRIPALPPVHPPR